MVTLAREMEHVLMGRAYVIQLIVVMSVNIKVHKI